MNSNAPVCPTLTLLRIFHGTIYVSFSTGFSEEPFCERLRGIYAEVTYIESMHPCMLVYTECLAYIGIQSCCSYRFLDCAASFHTGVCVYGQLCLRTSLTETRINYPRCLLILSNVH